MKINKFIFAAAVAALALAHSASAQVNIYISGAPATRAIWNQAVIDTLNTYGTGSPTLVEYYTATSGGFNNSNQIAVTGGNISGTAVTIYGSWDGSTSGNQSVAYTPANTNTNFEVEFINLGTASPGQTGTANLTNLQFPTINLSDTKQNSLPFNNTTTLTSPATTYVALTEATPTSPAITGFEFLTNAGAPASISNLTTNLARQLFTSDYGVPLAFFSGSSGDQQTIVYPIGRDIGSGSRYIFDAESGIGTANNASVVQFTPQLSGTFITDIVDYPSASGTINEISFPEGNGGYSSTSAEELPLEAQSNSASVGYVIGYLTDSDAAQAHAKGAQYLTWNGTAYSVGNIQQGSYTFWSFLHVYYNSSNISSIAQTFANDLSHDISTDGATGAILSSTLKVTRTNDGGLVSPTYSIP